MNSLKQFLDASYIGDSLIYIMLYIVCLYLCHYMT